MKILVLIPIASLALAAAGFSQIGTVPGLEVAGPYSTLKNRGDGIREEFGNSSGDGIITKTTYGPDGEKPMLRTVYRLDKSGKVSACDIFGGGGQKLYKSRYGYSQQQGPHFGKLVEERIYDVRVKRFGRWNREEVPVKKFFYTYNADGTRNWPISATLTAGETYEQDYGWEMFQAMAQRLLAPLEGAQASGLTIDPFQAFGPGANPSAKLLNR